MVEGKKQGEGSGFSAGDRVSCPFEGKHALIVDDDQIVADLNAMMVENMGLRALKCRHGEEVLELSDEQVDHCAIAILDAQIPGLNGVELSEKLRERKPELPVLLVSGFDRDLLEKRMELPPSIPLLVKPYLVPQFCEQVRLYACCRNSGADSRCDACPHP